MFFQCPIFDHKKNPNCNNNISEMFVINVLSCYSSCSSTTLNKWELTHISELKKNSYKHFVRTFSYTWIVIRYASAIVVKFIPKLYFYFTRYTQNLISKDFLRAINNLYTFVGALETQIIIPPGCVIFMIRLLLTQYQLLLD